MDETKQRSPRIWPDDECVLRFAVDVTDPDDAAIERMMHEHGEQITAALGSRLPQTLRVRLADPEEPMGGTITQSIHVERGERIGAQVTMVWSDHVDRRGIEVYVDVESPAVEQARLARLARWIGIGAAAGCLATWLAEMNLIAGVLVGAMVGLFVSSVLGALQPNQLGLAAKVASENESLADELRRALHDAFPEQAVN